MERKAIELTDEELAQVTGGGSEPDEFVLEPSVFEPPVASSEPLTNY